MRKQTKHSKQLQEMYSKENGRMQGQGAWKKFPFFWFLLFLTYKCTRRCSYCYAFNQVGDNNCQEMDESTFSRLLEWIPEVWKVNNVKVNVISFLGGEPLLRTDRIKKIMESVFRNTDGMQGLVNTNADLVDSVNWDDLEDIQWITVNITDITIDELSRRMKIICERSNAINQTIAATLDDYNLERIIDVSRFGLENGYRLRYSRDLYRGIDAEYKKRLLKKYHELCDLFESFKQKGYKVHTTFLFDTLIPSWDLDISPFNCGKRVAAVYPDGSIGPCLRDHSFKTGTIFDPDPMKIITCEKFHYELARPGTPDECKNCDSGAVCQGGCPHDKLLLTGTAAGKSLVCDIHREIIPRLKHIDAMNNQ